MSTATIAPVNPFAAEAKPTVMSVMRRDRAKFIGLVSDPKNWNVMTRCTGWETRDLVGHMIDVMEGYFKNWDAAKKGETPKMEKKLAETRKPGTLAGSPPCERAGSMSQSSMAISLKTWFCVFQSTQSAGAGLRRHSGQPGTVL